MDSTTKVAVLTENTLLDVMAVSILLTVNMDNVSHCISEENEIETTL